MKKYHADEQFLARKYLRELPETIARQSRRLEDLTADIATMAAHAEDAIVVGERSCRRDEVLSLLASRLESLPEAVFETRRFELGSYRGLRFGLVLHRQHAPDVYLGGAAVRQASLSRDFHGPRAIWNAVERLIACNEPQREAARNDLLLAQGQLRDYEARLGQPFPHEDYQRELADLRDCLRLVLSGQTPEAGTPELPPAEGLSERICSLKASHTVEPGPGPRKGSGRTTAERPVTARIRERSERDGQSSLEADEGQAVMPAAEDIETAGIEAESQEVAACPANSVPRLPGAPGGLSARHERPKTRQARLF